MKETTRKTKTNWMDNIKMDFGGMDWIDLPQDRDQCRALESMIMNEFLKMVLKKLTRGGFSRTAQLH
jgi:hypothetical protein